MISLHTKQLKQFIGVIFLGATFNLQAADIANGKVKFITNCLVCHGDRGLGDGIAAANLAKRPANINEKLNSLFKTDAKLSQSVLKGKTGMPAFRSILSNTDVADIFAYIRSVNP